MAQDQDLDSIPVETIAGRIRPHLPDIERKLKAGVKHRQIVAWLHGQGINVSLHTFRSVLYDWRKRQVSVSARPESKDLKTPAKVQSKKRETKEENPGSSPVKDSIEVATNEDVARYERAGKT